MVLSEQLEKQGNWLFRYRSFLPVALLVAGYIHFIYYKTNPSDWLIALALFTGFVGLAIRVYTVGFAAEGTSGRNTAGQVADSINTTGIYSIVRNPLYLGNFFMWLAVAILTIDIYFILIFCLVFWLYYERIIYAEEGFLTRKYGERYLTWAAATPAFIPDFTKYIKPETKFNLKKVLRKEKDGLLAIALLFFLFDTSAHLRNGYHDIVSTPILVFLISVLILYAIIKYLKYNTLLLKIFVRF